MTSTSAQPTSVKFVVKNQIAHMRLRGEPLVTGISTAIAAANHLACDAEALRKFSKKEQRIIHERLPFWPICSHSESAEAVYRFAKPMELAMMGMVLTFGCHALALRYRRPGQEETDLEDIPEDDVDAIGVASTLQNRIKKWLDQCVEGNLDPGTGD